MNDVIRQINTLLPHGYCFSWDPGILWLLVISDSLIALAYFSIPVALWVFVQRRADLQFKWIFLMFGMFIMACGITHVMDVWTIWQPDYWLDGAIRAYTAIVSIATAALLWPLLPRALALPSPGELERINTELQAEVAMRTAAEQELRIANKALREQVTELEAVSYAISHDLRAPLRHIDGYGTILQQEHSTALDESGRKYLGRIVDSTRHLGELIDGLLTFTRSGSVALSLQLVDTEQLVRTVLRTLMADAPQSRVEIDVAALPTLNADPTLLSSVFMNLIDNALKYSRDRKPARIEIGIANESRDEVCFFVRDNGAGFDMRYADKLFGVFQRLHHPHEFEGTGVGLANVRRIVTRHGGRVWAEAKVGEGATFYFSISKSLGREEAADSSAHLTFGELSIAKSGA
jgi:signal transduction histidine kinase